MIWHEEEWKGLVTKTCNDMGLSGPRPNVGNQALQSQPVTETCYGEWGKSPLLEFVKFLDPVSSM